MSQLGGQGGLPTEVGPPVFPGAPVSPVQGVVGGGVVRCQIVAVRRSGAIVASLGTPLADDYIAPANEITYDVRFWPNQGLAGTLFNLTPDQWRQTAVDIHPARPGNPVPGYLEGNTLKFTCVEPEAFEECQ